MLDLVPLTRPRWKVTDRNRETRAIGELLQFPFPQAQARAVTPTGIRGDQQRLGLAIGRSAHLLPPPSNRLHGEGGGVVIDADAHPAFIAVEIVDAIRNGLAAPGVLIRKSWTRTRWGDFAGRHVRPTFLKSPTSS